MPLSSLLEIQSRFYTLRLRLRLLSSSSSNNMLKKAQKSLAFDKGVAERSPFCLLTIGPITSKGFFNYTQLATWNFVAQQVACGVVIRATKLCYLHSNNVAPQLARKCCRYYLALKHNLINKSL